MHGADCYFNNWESCYQIDVDRFFNTKTNIDFEAPPHILNSGRLSPGYIILFLLCQNQDLKIGPFGNRRCGFIWYHLI